MVYRPMLKIHEIYLRMISKCIILSTEGGRGDVPLSAITTKFSVLLVSPVSRHMFCAG